MGNVDWTVFRWINDRAGDYDWLDSLGKTASNNLALAIMITLMIGWLAAVSFRAWRERSIPRELLTVVITAGATLALGLAINQIIGHIWFRARPYDTHPGANLLVGPSADPSFPSDHATSGFALAFGSATRLPRTAAIVLIETVLMSLGRIFVGRHYPGDILASLGIAAVAALGIAWAVEQGRGLIDRIVSAINGIVEQLHLPVRLT